MDAAEKGMAGYKYGYKTAPKIAEYLGTKLIRKNSNEVILDDELVVIKSAKKDSPFIGVTKTMLNRLKWILAALQNQDGSYTLYRVEVEWFKIKAISSDPNRNPVTVMCKDIRHEGKEIDTVFLDAKFSE